jgi:Spy/CpxP family protein refolding chaperone
MKPMKKRLAILGLTSLLIVSAGGAMAFGGHHDRHDCDRGKGDNWRSPAMAISQLDGLSDEQRDQLKQIRRDARDSMRELRDAMRDNRTELRDAMIDQADLESVRALAKKQGDQVARMIVLRAEMRDRISGVLTEAQRQQLADMRNKAWDGDMRGDKRHPRWDDDMPRERMRY